MSKVLMDAELRTNYESLVALKHKLTKDEEKAGLEAFLANLAPHLEEGRMVSSMLGKIAQMVAKIEDCRSLDELHARLGEQFEIVIE